MIKMIDAVSDFSEGRKEAAISEENTVGEQKGKMYIQTNLLHFYFKPLSIICMDCLTLLSEH